MKNITRKILVCVFTLVILLGFTISVEASVGSTDVIPKLTSNTSASPIIVSADNEYSGSYAAWKAFDNIFGESNGGWETVLSNPVGHWIKVDFGDAKMIKKVNIQSDKAPIPEIRTIKDFKIQASNDNTVWIDQYVGAMTRDANIQSFDFFPTGSFRYWRVLSQSTYPSNANGYLGVSEIEMFEGPRLSPSDFTAIAGNAKIGLSWASIDGATAYNVKRATSAGGPYTTLASVMTTTSYLDTTVTNGTTYYYVVSAMEGIESINSNEVSAMPYIPNATMPSAPTNLSAVAGNSKVNLSWNVVTGANTYTIKRSITSGGTYETVTDSVYENSYLDTSVTNDTVYYYIVTATNTVGESANSNEVLATPRSEVLPGGHKAILELAMTNGNIKEFDLTSTELNAFLNWYDDRSGGSGKTYYALPKSSNVLPFLSRTEYIQFDKIFSFEVKDYNN